MSCYASANCRSECATYQAVCGKRATLLSNAQDGRNRLTGWNVKRPAIRAWGQYHSRVIGSTGGECGQLRRRHSGKGRAVPERLPVDPYFVMRALSAANASGVCAVRSEIENYRAKAKKFARLAAVAKSPRHSRQCRKLAEMYWALALGEEPEHAPPSKSNVKGSTRWPPIP